jgi:hypothetical protein
MFNFSNEKIPKNNALSFNSLHKSPMEFSKQITIPDGCNNILWKPCDRPCIIDKLEITLQNKKITPQIINGTTINGKIIFATHDPQITINPPSKNHPASKLHITANICPLNFSNLIEQYNAIAQEYANSIINKNQEIKNILNSKSYKIGRTITSPIRLFKKAK